jgi:very-short-patch-repair endonuclease
MQNVATRRRDRINSDEEERFRLGYELRTGIRFAMREGVMSFQSALVVTGAEDAPILKYGPAATLWRMNLGWRRRKVKEIRGYQLDVERGFWARNQEAEDDPNAPDDPMSPRTERVVPYAEDTRNSLILMPGDGLTTGQMASLEAALKLAIQVRYQLEDRELGSEPLPTPDDRRTLLFYEASEGGAGVLRRLVHEASAFPAIARTALELLHFDPDTGADREHAPGAGERCEAACYDCMLSYYNQRDHRILDRQAIAETLLTWSRSPVEIAPGPVPRPEHVARLARACQSDLERRWLSLVDRRGHRLPDDAQGLLDGPRVRPDFIYWRDAVAIFVDGPHHDEPDRRRRDQEDDDRLAADGLTVIRFPHDVAWEPILDRYQGIFGRATVPIASPAPQPEPPRPIFDASLYDDRWHASLRALVESPGVAVEPGEEVMRGGRAIDLDLATVRLGDRALKLVDLDGANARPVASALEEQGHRVLRVRADMPDVVERVLRELRG